MAREETPQFETVASGKDPDDFSSGRWPNDEGGEVATIKKVRYVPGQYPNSKDSRHYGFSHWWVTTENGIDQEFQLRAFWLPTIKDGKLVSGHVPSNTPPDEKYAEPAGGSWEEYAQLGNPEEGLYLPTDESELAEYEGIYVRGGSKIPSNTEHRQMLESFKECGFEDWDHSVSCFEGLTCLFILEDQKYGNKKNKDGGENKVVYQTVVIADILSKDKKENKQETSGKKTTTETKKTTTTKKNDTKKSNGSGDLNSRVLAAIISQLQETDGGTLSQSDIVNTVLDQFTEDEVPKVFALLQGKGSGDFWKSAEGIVFEPRTKTVALAG